MAKRQLRLGAFMRPVSIHTGAWRYPGAWPDANFNFAHIKRLDPETGSRQIRRLLHGRPSGRAEHADQCAQAQPHRDLVRAVHAAVGAGRRHRTYRADRDGIDHVRRALSCRPPLRLARSHQRRTRRLEYRHHLQSGRGAEFRARRAHGACRALQAGARVLRRGHRPVGFLCRRRLCRDVEAGLYFDPAKMHVLDHKGKYLIGARPAQHRPPGAGLAGDRAGRRLG